MFNAKTIDNFISIEESNKILEFVKGIEPWDPCPVEFWDNRGLHARNIYNSHSKEIGELLYNIRINIGEQIKSLYNLEEIYPDLLQVIRWFPGIEQTPHFDDMKDKHREFGSIVYLNDDYSGGHTYYPNYNIDIKPEIGKLAIHPGDEDHLHGVSKVEDSIRYTIISFWTQDESKFDQWII